jgi:predicted glycogen debranching enzyme
MKLPALDFPKPMLTRFGEVLGREWIVTNGLGGYASSTVPSVNTRKYHGLLVAALYPPGDRTVCLAKLDEDLIVGDTILRLGANEFSSGFYPQGYQYLKEFKLDPFPTYSYEAGNVALQKTIFLLHHKNAVTVLYCVSNSNTSDVTLRLYPMLTCRYYHTVIDRSRIPLHFTQQSSVQQLPNALQPTPRYS